MFFTQCIMELKYNVFKESSSLLFNLRARTLVQRIYRKGPSFPKRYYAVYFVLKCHRLKTVEYYCSDIPVLCESLSLLRVRYKLAKEEQAGGLS